MNIRPFLMPAFLLTVSGGLAAWLLLAEPPDPLQEQAARMGDAGGAPAAGPSPLPSVDTGQTVAQQTVTAPLPDDIRDVSPEGVSAPRVDGSLKRIEPSKRYLELKDPPVEPIPDGPIELVRVQVLDGGHIKSDRLTVTLAHIKPLKLDETCLSRLGGSWPCGARARTFLRGLVRQFKVTCEKIEETGPQQILATCTRGKFDLSKRLVRYGWADPGDDAGSELIELAEQARNKKIGKWQSEWLSELPKTSWEDDPAATLPGLEELEPEIVEWSLRTEGPSEAQQGFEAPPPSPVQ
jgi:endonuclease YncB( thermonuclease family)